MANEKTELEAKAKAKEKAKAKAEAEAKAEAADDKLKAEAEALGVKGSRILLAGFKSKKNIKPEDIVREEERVAAKAKRRLAKNVDKARVRAKMSPIEKRVKLLVSRFKAVISKRRAHTYSDKIIKAWTEEYNLIKSSPRSWKKQTNNGKTPFISAEKKKKTAREQLEAMDLE